MSKQQLTELDSPTRLIDAEHELTQQQIDSLLEQGWRLICITEQVVRTRAAYIRHSFRHVDAPLPGAI